MNRLCHFILLSWMFLPSLLQAEESVIYRLFLTDKGESTYSIDRPEEFLSAKAIERRAVQGFPIDETDLPISPTYFSAIHSLGASVLAHSKWVNTITVLLPSEHSIEAFAQLPFVSKYQPVWRGSSDGITKRTTVPNKYNESRRVIEKMDGTDYYGDSQIQIEQLNGLPLHSAGFRGEGISIAILDGGFAGIDTLLWFDLNRIKEVKNFTHEYTEDFGGSQDHGTKVLSCMLPNIPYDHVGTAPGADYYLFKTEVNSDEYPVEEDYWVAALEYADSLGIDIVTSSLGYSAFADESMDYSHQDLDGFTVPASRAASLAARKGMILFNSSGNNGRKEWRKLNIPADASDILTVGSVESDGTYSAFSSQGYTADGRVKPDVMALGSKVTIIASSGKVVSNGTSFSCPIMAGMTACLWQALPHLNSLEVMQLVRESANQYEMPDSCMGYGIPDFDKAYQAGQAATSLPELEEDTISYNSQENTLTFPSHAVGNTYLKVFSLIGNAVVQQPLHESEVNVASLGQGLYIACLLWKDHRSLKKFIR